MSLKTRLWCEFLYFSNQKGGGGGHGQIAPLNIRPWSTLLVICFTFNRIFQIRSNVKTEKNLLFLAQSNKRILVDKRQLSLWLSKESNCSLCYRLLWLHILRSRNTLIKASGVFLKFVVLPDSMLSISLRNFSNSGGHVQHYRRKGTLLLSPTVIPSSLLFLIAIH